jgi:hypothetical protein
MLYQNLEVINLWLVAVYVFSIIFFSSIMSETVSIREKRLSVGARVSGTFGDFYVNPDPNVKRRKRQRIYGVVQEACGPRKYRVCFDSGLIVDCFSNTLRLEKPSASVPADVLAAAVSRDTPISTEVTDEQLLVIENEAAANDIEMEEHLPDGQDGESEEDDDDTIEAEDTIEVENEQRPVGVLNIDNEQPTTYAGRKEASNRRIAALVGTKVSVSRGRAETLEWIVVEESKPETMEVPKESVGLSNYRKLMDDAQPGTFIAQLFLCLMYEVRLGMVFKN